MIAQTHTLNDLENMTSVFRDREEGGSVLVSMLAAYRDTDTLVLAVPAGGLPVAAKVARGLGLELDVAVVSKITMPWNSEVGCGAVAFDGSVLLNHALIGSMGLANAQTEKMVATTQRKVRQRTRTLRPGRPALDLRDRRVLLVDDGLASGFTMRAAIRAVRSAGAHEVIVATPTAHAESLDFLRALVDGLYVPNVRSGLRYAVADAYAQWHDLTEDEARAYLPT